MKRALIALGIVFIAQLVFGGTFALAQSSEPPLVGTEAATKFIQALRQSDNPALSTLAAVAIAGSPRFIFVPGILGSQISIKREGEHAATDVWGGNNAVFSAGDLSIKDGDAVEAAPLHDVSYILGHKDVYGEALTKIADYSLADPDFLSEFSYDWRQDNAISAQQLQKWICQKRDIFSGHPIIFLSHSMGGLVTAYWYEHEREKGCSDGSSLSDSSWINVAQVIFLGTPIYGSPKAIVAFTGGYFLAANRSPSIFGAMFRSFDRNTLSKSLNRYGASFPSAYQLLPIYEESCFNKSPRPVAPAYFKRPDGTEVPILSLFDPGSWKKWHWPTNLPDGVPSDKFYSEFLTKALSGAKDFLCDLANYDLSQHVKVTYIYGKLPQTSTPSGLQFTRSDDGTLALIDCAPMDANCEKDMNGDGVVPEFVARDSFRANADDARATPLDHASLLASEQLAQYISDRLDDIAQASTRATVLAAKPSIAPTVFDIAAKQKAFLPMSLGSSNAGDKANLLIGQANVELASKLGLTAKQLSDFAANSSDPKQISHFTAISQQLGAQSNLVVPNWLKAAKLDSDAGNYGTAVESYSSGLNAVPPGSDRTKVQILNDRGNLLVKMKSIDAAKSDFGAAASLGDAYARQRLGELK